MGLIPVPKVKQSQSNWCWAACCESFTGYYKKKIKTQHEFLLLVGDPEFQTRMAKHAHGEALNIMAQPTDYAKLLKEILGAELNVHLYASKANLLYSKEQIKGAIDQDRIFIVYAALRRNSWKCVIDGRSEKLGVSG